jgi:hypothetical protein
MRHFFSVDADGVILGSCTAPGGYGDDHDLTDPECAHPTVIGHRRIGKSIPGFDRFVEYICPCSEVVEHCQCASTRASDAYAEGSELVIKPELTVLVDGQPLAESTPADTIVQTPGTTILLQLQADVPDGHQVTLRSSGIASVIREDLTLTFTEGQTEEAPLSAPAHGMVGGVRGFSKYVRQFMVPIKGWA